MNFKIGDTVRVKYTANVHDSLKNRSGIISECLEHELYHIVVVFRSDYGVRFYDSELTKITLNKPEYFDEI